MFALKKVDNRHGNGYVDGNAKAKAKAKVKTTAAVVVDFIKVNSMSGLVFGYG